jgi:hypothetical protein
MSREDRQGYIHNGFRLLCEGDRYKEERKREERESRHETTANIGIVTAVLSTRSKNTAKAKYLKAL